MVNVESMVPPVHVQVVLGRGPRDLQTWSLELPPGTPLSQALTACGLCAEPQAEDGTPLAVAIWGKARPLDTPLRDLDRVELLRPLRVDPKEARRQRYRKQPRAEQG